MSTSTTPHIERTIAETLDKKLARRGVVQHEAPVVSVIAERLQRFLADRIDGDFEVIDLRRMAGGASKEQFVFGSRAPKLGTPLRGLLQLRVHDVGQRLDRALPLP